jgi:hypothetical protein
LRGVGIGLWFAVHGDLLLTLLYLILEQVIFEFEVGNAPLTISTFVIYTDCPGRERTAACQALGQLTFDGFDRSSTLVHLSSLTGFTSPNKSIRKSRCYYVHSFALLLD